MQKSSPLLVLLSISCCIAFRGPYETGAKREDEGTRLQVHIVPHSHDDAGWLKTVDQYYWGLRQDIQPAGVQYILDTVVMSLAANPDRRFSFAEMAFFSRWWHQQGDETRALVTKLVAEGRLNFVNGGYVQHDEAAAHFVAMIDQTTRGHRFLKEAFNFVPTVNFQVDPFGHSSIQAGLLGPAFGFDAVFFGRADYQDMHKRAADRQLELLWRGTGSGPSTPDADSDSTIFTGNFASGNYGPPPGFWWEWTNSPDPVIADDRSLKEYNVDERVESFIQRCLELSNVTQGRDIMLTMGSDFHYSNAHVWYKNLDKLIHYVNKDGRIHAFYSSPADYVSAKHSYNITWQVKYDDFFPYADTPHSYWTGYFTSRASSKGYIRSATAYLQAARQLEAYIGRSDKGKVFFYIRGPTTDSLEEAISICQHHDAITGTAKQHVANDYHSRIHHGLVEAQQVVVNALKRLISRGHRAAGACPRTPQQAAPRKLQAEPTLQTSLHQEDDSHSENEYLHLEGCLQLNVSSCAATVELSRMGAPIFTVQYNPLAWSRLAPVRVPISTASTCQWRVFGPEGQEIAAQVVPVADSTISLQQQLSLVNATDPLTTGDAEIIFNAELPPLGYSSYVLHPSNTSERSHNASSREGCPADSSQKQGTPKASTTFQYHNHHRRRHHHSHSAETPLSISNGLVTLEFDEQTGLMSSIALRDGPAVQLSAALRWYNSSDGLNSEEDRGQASGAYIFRPNGDYPIESGSCCTRKTKTQHRMSSFFSNFLPFSCSSNSHSLQRRANGVGTRGASCCRDGSPVAMQVIEGEEVSEVRQVFADWATLITRLYKDQTYVEVEWTVGPIPFEDGLGREVILRYSSPDIKSGDEFFTDANGRGMMRRKVNSRDTWDLNVTEPVAGNYYPVTAAAYIQDEKTQFAVLTDRAQGAASLHEGELELMLHRRTLVDDRRGVREPLNETLCGCTHCDCPGLIVRGVHWLVLTSPETAATTRRRHQQLLNDPLISAFGPLPLSPGLATTDRNPPSTPGETTNNANEGGGGSPLFLYRTFSLTNERILHHGAHLLTLLRTKSHTLLVRIAHLFDDKEDSPLLGGTLTEDVGALLSPFRCTGRPVELTLSGNQLKSEAEERKLRFRAGDSMNLNLPREERQQDLEKKGEVSSLVDQETRKNDGGEWLVQLKPMEVRTYEVDC